MQITGFLFGLTEQNRLTINHAIKKLFAEQDYQVQQLLQRGHLIKATVKDLNPNRRHRITEFSNLEQDPSPFITLLQDA
jgi:hypothetical protein